MHRAFHKTPTGLHGFDCRSYRGRSCRMQGTLAAEIDIYAMSEWGGGLGDRQGGGGGRGRNLPPPAPFNLGSRHFSLTFRTLKATLPALPPPVHFPPSFLPGLQALSTSLPTPTSEGRKKKERKKERKKEEWICIKIVSRRHPDVIITSFYQVINV